VPSGGQVSCLTNVNDCGGLLTEAIPRDISIKSLSQAQLLDIGRSALLKPLQLRF